MGGVRLVGRCKEVGENVRNGKVYVTAPRLGWKGIGPGDVTGIA